MHRSSPNHFVIGPIKKAPSHTTCLNTLSKPTQSRLDWGCASPCMTLEGKMSKNSVQTNPKQAVLRLCMPLYDSGRKDLFLFIKRGNLMRANACYSIDHCTKVDFVWLYLWFHQVLLPYHWHSNVHQCDWQSIYSCFIYLIMIIMSFHKMIRISQSWCFFIEKATKANIEQHMLSNV